MNQAELDEVRGRSFGDIICDTSRFIKATPKDVFRINSPLVQCVDRPGLNIRAFQVFKATSEPISGVPTQQPLIQPPLPPKTSKKSMLDWFFGRQEMMMTCSVTVEKV